VQHIWERGHPSLLAELNKCGYINVVLEFDADKNAINVSKHGLSLAEAERIGLLTAAVEIDDREDYGETRYRAFARVDGQGFCFVFTVRGTVVRAISLRRAHEKEMRRYER
jgi:uncharacterized DUF497 family protein